MVESDEYEYCNSCNNSYECLKIQEQILKEVYDIVELGENLIPIIAELETRIKKLEENKK
jgi:hypothetical protein